jgi:hypothetical protein
LTPSVTPSESATPPSDGGGAAQDDGNLGGGAIAGIVIGAVVAVGTVASLIVYKAKGKGKFPVDPEQEPNFAYQDEF